MQVRVAQRVDQLSQAVQAIEQRVGLPLVPGGDGRRQGVGDGVASGDLLRRAAPCGMTVLGPRAACGDALRLWLIAMGMCPWQQSHCGTVRRAARC